MASLSLANKILRKTPSYILVSGYIRMESFKLVLIPAVIIGLCYKYYREPIEIPLKVHSYRGALSGSDNNGPKWLIAADDNKPDYHYWGATIPKGEEDWMIFSVDTEKSIEKYGQSVFWLKQLKFQNAQSYSRSAPKEIRIEIGNAKENKWIICKPNPIKIKVTAEYQSFEISAEFDINKPDFKVIFLSPDKSSDFIVHRLRLLGV